MIESYVFRRAICGIPTNSLNKIFASLSREVEQDNYLESVKIALITKTSYKRFPKNEEFRQAFIVKDIYNFRNCSYLLGKLENYDHEKELINPREYSVEHIIPQNSQLSSAWKQELGEFAQAIQGKYLHTIGNLTLTGYNSEYSDHSFSEKRDMKNGFADSPLYLNRMLAKLDHWNEYEIKKRASILADIAGQIWSYPDVQLTSNPVNTEMILQNIFQTSSNLNLVTIYIQQAINLIDYDKVKHILSITCPQEQSISINLGQWLILGFKPTAMGLEAIFALDCDIYSDMDSLAPIKVEQFSTRWRQNKNIKLVWLPWNDDIKLSEEFLSGWHGAIYYAYEVFGGWNSSSYMTYHQPELAAKFLS